MLKFIKHHLDTIDGVSIYPVLSFVIFFTFFLLVLAWLRKASHSHIDRMKRMPFDAQELKTNNRHAY